MKILIKITREGDIFTVWTKFEDDPAWCQQWQGELPDGAEQVIGE